MPEGRALPMLQRLLALVASSGIRNVRELAQQLNVSEGLVEGMLDQLQHMGYLRIANAACSGECEHCSLATSCTTDRTGRVWMLTAKGQRIAQHKPT